MKSLQNSKTFRSTGTALLSLPSNRGETLEEIGEPRISIPDSRTGTSAKSLAF